LIEEVLTFFCDGRVENFGVEVLNTGFSLIIGQQLWGDKLEIGNNFWERREHIKIPVSSTISNDETLEVVKGAEKTIFLEIVVLVNLPGEVWHIDASITLTRDIDFVCYIFWEQSVKVFNGCKCIFGL